MTRMMTSSETSNQDLAAIAAGHLFVSSVFFPSKFQLCVGKHMEKRGEPVDGYGTIWMVIRVDSLFHWELQYLW